MLPIMKFGVISAFLFAVVSLAFLVLKTFSFGKKKLYAEPRGDVKKGIIYAFGKGMMPWEKESAGNHLPTYIAGIFYHSGIFLTLLYLATIILAIQLPPTVILFFQALCLAGAVSGLGLLVKRLFSPMMRALSCPDDFAANILVDVFLIAAFLHTLGPVPNITLSLFSTATIMFLYMPLGKIRHCFFFFYVRVLFGAFYGRRGVFPNNFSHQGTKTPSIYL
ncbi:MAG TPA: hypothetical protein VK186_27645 [Candidatus Deferrimicrobium sp.]|nr:hypothetical protein [Candidatus Deferrimicrobium sp.]